MEAAIPLDTPGVLYSSKRITSVGLGPLTGAHSAGPVRWAEGASSCLLTYDIRQGKPSPVPHSVRPRNIPVFIRRSPPCPPPLHSRTPPRPVSLPQ